MANEFVVRKGLIVNGSGSVVVDVQGSQGQLFSITDELSGSLFSVNDISGTPVLEAFSDDTVKIGTFNQEGLIVTGSQVAISTGSTAGFDLNVSGSVQFSGGNFTLGYPGENVDRSITIHGSNSSGKAAILREETSGFVITHTVGNQSLNLGELSTPWGSGINLYGDTNISGSFIVSNGANNDFIRLDKYGARNTGDVFNLLAGYISGENGGGLFSNPYFKIEGEVIESGSVLSDVDVHFYQNTIGTGTPFKSMTINGGTGVIDIYDNLSVGGIIRVGSPASAETIQRDGSNNLVFTTSGISSNRLIIYNSGNVEVTNELLVNGTNVYNLGGEQTLSTGSVVQFADISLISDDPTLTLDSTAGDTSQTFNVTHRNHGAYGELFQVWRQSQGVNSEDFAIKGGTGHVFTRNTLSVGTDADNSVTLNISGSAFISEEIRSTHTATSDVILNTHSNNNNDYWLWRISNNTFQTSSDYGFGLKYTGTESSNDNALELYSDNQTAASNVRVWRILQDGSFFFNTDVTVSGSTSVLKVLSDATIPFRVEDANSTREFIFQPGSGNFDISNATLYLNRFQSGDIVIGTGGGNTYVENNLTVTGSTNLFDNATIHSSSLTLTGTGANEGALFFDNLVSTNEFGSGFAGFGAKLDQTADNDWLLELDSLNVRGTFSAYELLINQVRATNGSIWVASSGKVDKIDSGSYSAFVSPLEGLVGYYTFDNSGSLATDYSGHRHNGTVSGDPQPINGIIGKGLEFVQDHITLPDVPEFNPSKGGIFSDNSWTVSLWINPYTLGSQLDNACGDDRALLIGVDYNSTTGEYSDLRITNNGSIIYSDAASISASGIATTNQWYHVVLYHDSNLRQLKIYVNNILEDTVDTSAVTLNESDDVIKIGGGHTIGCGQDTNFHGIIDDVRTYNRVLTEDQITQLYNLSSSSIYPSTNLVGYYPVTEKDTGIIYDFSENDNTATYTTGYFSDGIVGSAFSGSAFVSSSDELNPTKSVTVAAWINASTFSGSFQEYVTKGDGNTFGGPNQYFLGCTDDERVWFEVQDTSNTRQSVNYSVSSLGYEGQWIHIAGTYNSGSAENTLYVNGVQVDQQSPAITELYTSSADLIIGRDPNNASRTSLAFIDDVRIYDRALSANEIKALADNPSGIKLSTAEDGNHGFQVGDLVKAQRYNGRGIFESKGIVTYVPNLRDFYVEPLRLSNPTLDLPKPGFEYVRIGNIFDADRQGAVYITADDTGAPYIDIIDEVSSHDEFNTGNTIKSRFGRLDGITSNTFGELDGYGSWIQNLYAEGSAHIAGTLTAGDNNGIGKTFYAGLIRRNLIEHSENFGFNSWTLSGGATLATSLIASEENYAPDNESVADEISFDGTNNSHLRYTLSNPVASAQYTFSIFLKKSSGTFTTGSNSIRIEGGVESVQKTVINSVSGSEWERLSVTATTDSTRNDIVAKLRSDDSGSFLIWGAQLEQDSKATNYQPTDGTILDNDNGYGAWMNRGGIGGTIQNPVLELDEFGIIFNATSIVSSSLTDNTIQIGNIYGSASGAIKLTRTGTDSIDGLFGYGTNGNESFALRLDGTSTIAGWSFDDTQFTSNGASGGDDGSYATSGITLSSNGWLSTPDFYIDSSGNAAFKGSITASAGNIGGWTIEADRIVNTSNTVEMSHVDEHFKVADASVDTNTTDFVQLFYNSSTSWGLIGRNSGNVIFRLGDQNIIAGWTFTNSTLTGGSVTLDSAGNISAGGTTFGTSGVQIQDTSGGRFYAGNGSTNFIQYDGSTLTFDTANTTLDSSGNLTANNINANNASLTGSIIADDGQIGGWTITSTYLEAGSVRLDSAGNISAGGTSFETSGVQIQDAAGGRLYAGNGSTNFIKYDGSTLTFDTANTTLDSSGNLTANNISANNASLTGSIIASSGQIGGWSINASSLTGGSISLLDTGTIGVGSTTFGNAGVQLDDTSGGRLYAGDGGSNFIQWDGTNLSWQGTNASLTTGGAFSASDAYLAGTISADAGDIAGWIINTEEIRSGDSDSSSSTGGHIRLRRANSVVGGNIYADSQTQLRGLQIQWHRTSNAGSIVFGEILSDASGNPDRSQTNDWVGIQAMPYNTDVAYFQLAFDSATDGSVLTNHSIAGWTFDDDALYVGTKDTTGFTAAGNITISSTGAIHTPGFFVDSSGNAEFQGTVTASNLRIDNDFSVGVSMSIDTGGVVTWNKGRIDDEGVKFDTETYTSSIFQPPAGDGIGIEWTETGGRWFNLYAYNQQASGDPDDESWRWVLTQNGSADLMSYIAYSDFNSTFPSEKHWEFDNATHIFLRADTRIRLDASTIFVDGTLDLDGLTTSRLIIPVGTDQYAT